MIVLLTSLAERECRHVLFFLLFLKLPVYVATLVAILHEFTSLDAQGRQLSTNNLAGMTSKVWSWTVGLLILLIECVVWVW